MTATASTQEKLSWLLGIPNGATHAVNYKTHDFAAEVKNTTDGAGVDVVIDFVGQSHWKQNLDSLARDGRMTMLAFLSGACGSLIFLWFFHVCCAGSIVPSVDLSPLLAKRLRIQGSTLRSRSAEYQSELIKR